MDFLPCKAKNAGALAGFRGFLTQSGRKIHRQNLRGEILNRLLDSCLDDCRFIGLSFLSRNLSLLFGFFSAQSLENLHSSVPQPIHLQDNNRTCAGLHRCERRFPYIFIIAWKFRAKRAVFRFSQNTCSE